MKKIYAAALAVGIGFGGYLLGRQLHKATEERCSMQYAARITELNEQFRDTPATPGVAAPGSFFCQNVYSPAFKGMTCQYGTQQFAVTSATVLGREQVGLQTVDLEQVLQGAAKTTAQAAPMIKVLPGAPQ